MEIRLDLLVTFFIALGLWEAFKRAWPKIHQAFKKECPKCHGEVVYGFYDAEIDMNVYICKKCSTKFILL